MTDQKYEFNLSDPDSWSKMPKPLLPEWLVKETLKIGGMVGDKPRFKWAWGMSEEVFIPGEDGIPEGWYLKYQLCHTEKVIGYKWMDNGAERCVTELKDVPKDVLAVPKKQIDQIGTPRWILEEWHEAGDGNGVYDRAAYYFHRRIVEDDQPENPETFLKPYREPNANDLEILKGYVKATATLTAKDIKDGVAEDRRKEAEASDKIRGEWREEMADELVATMPQMARLPRPPQEIIDRAWKKLEGN